MSGVISPQTAGEERAGPSLQSMLSTAELSRRPTRPPDHEGENRALMALARELSSSPDTILQKLAETALQLCNAHSAGLSILEDGDRRQNFHWRAIAGEWAPHVNGGTPRDFGPCGTVVDRNVALLCSHPERDFPYWAEVKPALEEALLVPFHIQGETIGTIWVVAHDASRRFDAEDLRVMTNLGAFTAAAYQAWLSVNATQRIAAIVDFSDDAIVSKDLNGVIMSWNRGAERTFGYAAEEVIGKSIMILIPPELQHEETEIIGRIRRGERVEHYETVRRGKHGNLIGVSLSVSPVRDTQGKIIGASKSARDITERKRAEEQIAILAREAEHRAKNVLATVQATVRLSQSDTADGLKEAITGRIQALTNVHRLFVQSRWTGAELRKLATEELAPYCQDGEARVQLDGASLVLEPSTAQAIAVTLHELATNAAKHGALSVAEGHVQIAWSHMADGQLMLRWSETGGPPVPELTRKGFGMRVIDSLIRAQLNGEARFDWRPQGIVCEIVLPLGSR